MFTFLSDHRKMLQSLGRPELHMALEVTIVSGSGQEHAGCLLLTSEVLFVVSLSEDTQQQAFPITEVLDSRTPLRSLGMLLCYAVLNVPVPLQVECQQEPGQEAELSLTLQQQTISSDIEVRLTLSK